MKNRNQISKEPWEIRKIEIASSFLRGQGRLKLLAMTFFIFFVGGCGQQRICPGLANAVEGRQMLADYAASVKPVRATGNCTLSYVNEKGEKFSQAFPMRFWYVNNEKFCIYGDVLFNPKGVCFAVNDGIYWAYAKPLGIYVKGNVDRAGEDYFSNPALLLDFLNTPNSQCDRIAFSKNGILCRDREKHKQKKIYIDTCSKAANKIIHTGQNSKAVLIINAEKYEKVKDAEFLFPNKLNYEYFDKKNGKNKLEIKLDSVKLWQPEEKQIKALFTPPEANEIKKEAK
ncbi:MAG: hypothetical protein ABFD79_16075 [Phycisphaerales bacterium]